MLQINIDKETNIYIDNNVYDYICIYHTLRYGQSIGDLVCTLLGYIKKKKLAVLCNIRQLNIALLFKDKIDILFYSENCLNFSFLFKHIHYSYLDIIQNFDINTDIVNLQHNIVQKKYYINTKKNVFIYPNRSDNYKIPLNIFKYFIKELKIKGYTIYLQTVKDHPIYYNEIIWEDTISINLDFYELLYLSNIEDNIFIFNRSGLLDLLYFINCKSKLICFYPNNPEWIKSFNYNTEYNNKYNGICSNIIDIYEDNYMDIIHHI